MRISTGQELVSIRGKLEVTQQKLADAAGVSIATIKNWERSDVLSEKIQLQIQHGIQNLGLKNAPGAISGNFEPPLSEVYALLERVKTPQTFDAIVSYCQHLRAKLENDL